MLAWSGFVLGLVKAITAHKGVKLLDLFFGLTRKGQPVVGPANVFHSYTWQFTVASTYMALLANMELLEQGKTTPFYWWDMFCQNQHNPGDVGATFSSTLEQVDQLVFSCPNFMYPKPLTRVWCQYELANAVMKGKRITVLPAHYSEAGGNAKSENQEFCEGDFDPNDSCVPVADSQASVAADKGMLLALVDANVEGGQARLNSIVREQFLKAALGYRLHYTCQWKRGDDDFLERVEAMLKAGADPNVGTNAYSNVDHLDNYGEDDAIAILRKYGGLTKNELVEQM